MADTLQDGLDRMDETISTMESQVDLFTKKIDVIFADLREFERQEEVATHKFLSRLLWVCGGLAVVAGIAIAWIVRAWR